MDKNGISWTPALLGRDTKKGMAVSKYMASLPVHSKIKFYKDNSPCSPSCQPSDSSESAGFSSFNLYMHPQANIQIKHSAGNSHLQRNLLNFYQRRGHIHFHTWSQSHQDIPAADSLLVHVAHEHSQPLLHPVMGVRKVGLSHCSPTCRVLLRGPPQQLHLKADVFCAVSFGKSTAEGMWGLTYCTAVTFRVRKQEGNSPKWVWSVSISHLTALPASLLVPEGVICVSRAISSCPFHACCFTSHTWLAGRGSKASLIQFSRDITQKKHFNLNKLPLKRHIPALNTFASDLEVLLHILTASK